MSKIQTIPVSELVRLNSVEPTADARGVSRETFIIPDYQRGYRWDAEKQVKALLNDILDFQNMTRSTDDRYCLQPIVVTQSSTHPGAWEVIDGQQRLTTLFLVMSASGAKTFNLIFETRSRSNEFLKKIISQEGHEDHSNPDFHFISEAWKYINTWITEREDRFPGFIWDFGGTLLKNVHVIWYDPESNNRKDNIDIFNRLNIGKIPLSQSELVKALILTKIKGIYSGTELTLRQAEISNEWYRMETELQKPQKWDFLIGTSTEEYSSHIDLLFDLMSEEKSQDKSTAYLWFEKQVTAVGNNQAAQGEKAIELWNRIKHSFGRINSWFCDNTPDTDPTIYHYVGYLLATGEAKISEIFKDSENLGKSAFIKYLHKKILDVANRIEADDKLSYDKDSQSIKKLLLLLNVLTCEEIVDGAYNRFPFDRYNKIERERAGSGWSLEHISAQHSKDPMKSQKAILAWLNETAKSLANITTIYIPNEEEEETYSDEEGEEVESAETTDIAVNEEEEEVEEEEISIAEQLADLKRRIDQMRQLPEKEIDIDEFNNLRDELIKLFETRNQSTRDNDIHELANLALLSAADNSALNNDIFPVKRDRIIKLEKKGSFIPPCTRNVFLKFYSPADTQPYYWSSSDRRNYSDAIKQIINQFKRKYE